MRKEEALIVAKSYLAELQEECPVPISFDEEITEEFSIGFVFFYNTVEYWKNRDFTKSLAGNEPLLVRKDFGGVEVLPSHQSVKRSIDELMSNI